MKQRIATSFQTLVADRSLLVVLGLFLFACIAVLIYLGLSIHASELQVVIHYTAFGTTNFYRDKWYYLLTFAALVILIAVAHTMLTYRILQQKGHDLAVAFAWLSIVLVIIVAATIYQVLKVAALT